MRQIIFVAIILVSYMVYPLQSVADTIVLKSGRKINATKCWGSGDIIKCKIYGQVIGYQKNDIAEFSLDSPPSKTVKGFRYDIWLSGISVQQAIDIAEANDLPFHRVGLISANKRFNPKMCRPYADTATKFYYKEQILGKWASLNLNFTPVSKKLFSVEIKFDNTGPSKDSEFRQQIEAMLREKYGKPIGINNHMGVYKTYDWKINDKAIVMMRPGSNYVLLTYIDNGIAKLVEKELSGQVRKGFTKNDKSKF